MSPKAYKIFPFVSTLNKDFFLIIGWSKFTAECVRKEKNYLKITNCIKFVAYKSF